MPSAQIIDFGPEPFTESIGNFAQNFSDSFFADQNRKKNDDIFDKIKKRYGPDAKPETILKDIMEAEGFDQEYKRNLIKDAKDYATLAGKKNLTPIEQEMQELRRDELRKKNTKLDKEARGEIPENQKKNFELQARRLDLEQQRIDQAANKGTKDLPELISKYTNLALKDTAEKIEARDKALLNSRVQSNIEDDKMPMAEAFKEALDYIALKNEILETAEIEKRPNPWGGPSSQQLQKSLEKAYEQLNELYEAGIDSQSDLRAMIKRAGWQPEEANQLLQAVYSSHGRKARVKPVAASKVEGSEQGVAQQQAGIDDILFGD